jgi:small subunit ribosomal protein S10e
MFIPKEHRVATFAYLFKEGVLVVKKDTKSTSHPSIEGPTNLEVLNLMKSLTSSGYVKTTFSWQYNYCYLTDTGVEYLRNYLVLPAEIVPNTHKKSTGQRPAAHDVATGGGGGGDKQYASDRPPAFRGGGGDRDRGGGDRDYRSSAGGGGFGRGGGV